MMDAIPIWGIFVAVVAIVIASIELGYQFGVAVHKRSSDEKESPVSAIAGSVLGLTAFILAFVFGIVSNRFDARKELVREDANAVRTVWLRSEFLPEAERAEAKRLVSEYLDARLTLAQTLLTDSVIGRTLSEAEHTQQRLWETAVANARKDMNSDVAALYIESINHLMDIHADRVTVGLQLRVPPGLWAVLILLTSFGMMSVGYQTGIAGSKRSMARPLLAAAFAIVITMIVSLDRPYGGLISVSQQPLDDVRVWIDAETAGNTPASNTN